MSRWQSYLTIQRSGLPTERKYLAVCILLEATMRRESIEPHAFSRDSALDLVWNDCLAYESVGVTIPRELSQDPFYWSVQDGHLLWTGYDGESVRRFWILLGVMRGDKNGVGLLDSGR